MKNTRWQLVVRTNHLRCTGDHDNHFSWRENTWPQNKINRQLVKTSFSCTVGLVDGPGWKESTRS